MLTPDTLERDSREVEAVQEREELKKEFLAVLAEIRSGVSPDVTEEEIEREIDEAIRAVRRERHNQRAASSA